jgi:hypothetical protein
MRIPILIISAASLITLGGIAKADDHLFQAVDSGGLTLGVSAPFQPHGANNHVPDTAPGRGSPTTSFDPSGEDLGTPSVGVDRLNPKAADKVPFGE